MSALLPCPFCGSGAAYVEDFYGEGFLSAVSCDSCSACVISAYDNGKDVEKRLVGEWNRRAATQQEKQA